MTPHDLDMKLADLQTRLGRLERVAVAFSGGVDSTLLLKVAVDTLGADNVLALTAKSPSLARGQLDDAIHLAKDMGVEHVILETHEFDDPTFAANPPDRCYHCRVELYRQLDTFLAERSLNALITGTNADDFGDYRPGIQAAREHGVLAPCADAGLTKADIRALSKRFNLPTFDKPASPCLATRVPYGQVLTPELMRQIDEAESALHALGFPICRVRHHGEVARVELPADQISRATAPGMRARIDEALTAAGYRYVALDLRGFRSGSMNETLDTPTNAKP